MPQLSAKTIDALKPGPKVAYLRDSQLQGLELYVTPNGVKTFGLRYRLEDGTRRRLSLGRWPVMDVAQARQTALDALRAVASGEDPARTKRLAREAAVDATIKTVADLAAALMEASRLRGVRPSTLAHWQWLFRKHILPRFGALRFGDLTSRDVRPFLRDVGSLSGPTTSNGTLMVIKRMYNFAVEEELLENNPLARVKPAFILQSRDRVLSDSELRAIWDATAAARTKSRMGDSSRDKLAVSPALALAVRLCALTCQRAGEILGIRWSEIDLKTQTWVLPAARSKSRRESVIPLSTGALITIREAVALSEKRYGRTLRPVDALFPSPPTTRLSRMRKHAADPSGLAPMETPSLVTAMIRLTKFAGVHDASAHDLRRTGATMMASERIGALGEIIARVLNHSTSVFGVTAIYNRYAYVAEKRRALQAWSELLAEITEDPTLAPSNPVEFAGDAISPPRVQLAITDQRDRGDRRTELQQQS